jgi:hypothetical protein
MAQAGDPEIVIKSPSPGDKLGPNFSVYGTCSAIGTASNPTITVSLFNGPAYITSVTATQNTANKTWEAVFTNVSPIANGNAEIRVKCSLMTNHLTISPMTITGMPHASITTPTGGNEFSAWGQVDGQGNNSNSINTIKLFVTHSGKELGEPQAVAMELGGTWNTSLRDLVPQDPPLGHGFVLHYRVVNPGLTVIEYGASGPFSVG